MKPALVRPWLAAALISLAPACALTSKADSNVFRYFTPEGLDAQQPPAQTVASSQSPAGIQLRLGRVTSAAYLRESIAYRDSSFEVGYFDDARWTERPDIYVRRALSRVLFEQRGMQEIVSGPGPTVDVELEAFEELRAPRHAARVKMTWTLRDDQFVRVQETFTVERDLPAGASTPSDVARAIGSALDEAVTRIAGRTSKVLAVAPLPGSPQPAAQR